MLQTTILNACHRALSARMVNFGGWDMPLNYGSQIEEHHAVRQHCGVFDVSHMCPVELIGPDVRPFLSRLLANDVAKLQKPGKAIYTCMLNEAGGIIDDLIIYFLSESHFRLVVNASTADKDIAWMQSKIQNWGLHVQLTQRRSGDKALAIIAIQGPAARETLWRALPETRADTENTPSFFAVQSNAYFIARTGYTGEDGFEIMLPLTKAASLWQSLLDAGAKPCGLGARDTLRLEAGLNLYGQDMDETVSPRDAALSWTVCLNTDRDFVGKSALLETPQKNAFLGLILLDKGVLRPNQKIICKQGDGIITSGTFSPTLQRAIALARLPLDVKIGDTVHVDIRGKHLKATVVKPVFAHDGKALI